ncbi:hypothetical protein MNV_290014 [Candidatus Methanoperedens nitroreducens]|uniref:Uncharacterized protein n=1 Tax=Candidatus Methanoperedens nitratireducens TaxID=1392998 RepID=A0A284VPT1_9EURY|nr:hypothetical protein MNV_290014 [Candidatus Methanoperedens nitroreducens]
MVAEVHDGRAHAPEEDCFGGGASADVLAYGFKKGCAVEAIYPVEVEEAPHGFNSPDLYLVRKINHIFSNLCGFNFSDRFLILP